ncbi:unnamed protein product [Blepharisma stoltei]|uniref:Dynein regulatory complex protein 12 n=1 Tax=Blepharisma stoltei TaxID=1481888 RepID=A0AAU9JD79_9CILI|nr:unnamed protein product [Blepharisma stoltei]
MGVKKKGDKKGVKKGKAKKEPENPLANLSVEEQYNARLVEWRSLQQILIQETEAADRERASENELRAKVNILCNDLEEEKKRTWDVTCDMTRQYKSMQQEKDEKIKVLEERIEQNQVKIQQRDSQLQEIMKEKEGVLREKEEEVKELRKKIDDMSSRFASILKDTLDQMKEKIEMVNKNWEEEMEVPMLKKLEDFAH